MKVCREHKGFLKRGMTYQLVSKRECEFCLAIKAVIKEVLRKHTLIEWGSEN